MANKRQLIEALQEKDREIARLEMKISILQTMYDHLLDQHVKAAAGTTSESED